MPAAIAAVSIGTSIYSAYKQHHAASEAAKTQQKGTDQALAAQNNAFAQQQNLYGQMQSGASSTLGRLLTPGAGARFAAGPQAPMSLGGAQPAQGGAPPAQGGQRRMVQLRAPDGSIGSVPEDLAQQFIAKGAQPVQPGGNVAQPRPMSLGAGRAAY